MSSEGVQDQLWMQRFDIARLVRYYAKESSFRSRWQTASQVALLLSSFSAVGTVLDLIGTQTLLSVVSVLGALFVVASYTWNHPSKTAAILGASEQCRVIDTKAKLVWSTLNNISDHEAMEQFNSLQKELDAATLQVERNGIGYSETRNVEAAEEAKKVLAHEPAPTPASGRSLS